MRRISWVVYAKRPFGGPAGLSRPLYPSRRHRQQPARRPRRRSRRLYLEGLPQNGATKIMKLKPDQFIRRFLLHTLPDGFHRIRRFGFMANGHRAAKLALRRKLLDRERTAPNDGESSPGIRTL
uniref:transposase n=1 Tax=Bradyrhizobium sp. NDS-1 TaxID=3080014 RepID=UPI00397DAC83